MLDPGFKQKGLDEPARVGGILDYPPLKSAISPALVGKHHQRIQERCAIFRINLIFNGDKHGATVRIHLVGRHRLRPVHRWIEINVLARLQAPAPEHKNAEGEAGRSHKMRGRKTDPSSYLSPGRTAQTHRPELNRAKQSESSPTHPRGQPDLRRDI